MEYSFTAWGHPNITGKHKRTLEFTRANDVSLDGDCILGISANFSVYDLRELVNQTEKLKMVISAGEISDEVIFMPNRTFNDEEEIVVRMGDFSSDRTFGVKADKACAFLKKELIARLKDPSQKIDVLITDV